MATSGELNGNNVDGTEGSYLHWQLAGQDATRSLVNWQAGWRFSTTGCRGLRLGSAVINGTTVWLNNAGGDGVHGFASGHNHRPRLQTASGSIWIDHGSDGTKTFSASVSLTGFSGLLSQGSTNFDLPQIVPGAPGTPSSADPGSTTATITWSAPSGIGAGGAGLTSRQVQISTTSNFSNVVIDNTTTWGTSYNATGLSKNTTYYVRVRAGNGAGFGPFSGTGVFTTDATAPGAPGTPSFSSVAGTSLTVSWSVPTDTGGLSITSYRVQRATNSGFSTGLVETDLSTTSLQVTGLAPGTTYWFRVRATNAMGNSSYSNGASVTTGVTVPGAPAAPSISNLTSVSASVSWSEPSSNGGSSITGYDVQRARNSSFTLSAVTIADDASPLSMTNLSPGTDYWVRVRAKNAAGAGNWSPSTQFKTLSGARVGNGSAWVDMLCYIGNGSTWVPHRIRFGLGSSWSN